MRTRLIGTRFARRFVAVVLTVFVGAVALPPAPAHAVGPEPPGPIARGAPGANGPCGVERSDVVNPFDERVRVWIYEPSGRGRPWTGGRCRGDHRPTVFLAHGYFVFVPDPVYTKLIEHLVSNGFVVIYPGYVPFTLPGHSYDTVDAGFVAGVEASGRVDLDNVGFLGHSFGAGMTPYNLQQAVGRGWGNESLWAAMLAPAYAWRVGRGPIEVPDHTRVLVGGYEYDTWVDNTIGIELFEAIRVPDRQKQHTTLHTDDRGSYRLLADHLVPITLPIPFIGFAWDNAHDYYGMFRPIDATARCALRGRWCHVDFSWMGRWSDGVPFRAATSTDNPVDVGPRPLLPCRTFLNPRPCPGGVT